VAGSTKPTSYARATGGTKLTFSLDYLIKAAQEAAHARWDFAFAAAASDTKGKDCRTDEN
jgi:hypothetical protein